MEAKLGQFLMVGFPGLTPSSEFLHFLSAENIGGVILFAENIESPKQLAELTTKLQAATPQELLIGIDHEGGRVFRMKNSFTHFPAMAQVASVAAQAGEELVFEMCKAAGEELRAVGINVNFAPVLDVATNPFNQVIGDRSFSANPQVVARLAVQSIKGYEAANIMSCGKHFPGHGDTNADSHDDFPYLAHTRARFDACEFIPFKAAIAAGVPAIMSAHISVPQLDSQNIASVSRNILSNILRKQLKFNGLVVSDDLNMHGIAGLMSVPAAAEQAINAGSDLLLLRSDLSTQQKTLEHLKSALHKKQLQITQLQASLNRLDVCKERYGSAQAKADLSIIAAPAHRELNARFRSA